MTTHNNTLLCDTCKTSISGRYHTAEGGNLCARCHDAEWRCGICNTPLRLEYYIIAGKKICSTCHTKPACIICGLPGGRDLVPVNAHQFVCPGCRPLIVMDRRDLSRSLALACSALKKEFGIITDTVRISRIELIEKGIIARRSRHLDKPFSVTGNAQDNGTICVQQGRSMEETICIIVHETGHLWQFAMWEKPREREPLHIEGFSMWLEYRVMLSRGSLEECRHLLDNPDPVYGEGLRFVLGLEKKGIGTEDILYGRF